MKKAFVLWARQYSKRLLTFLLFAWFYMLNVGILYEFIRLKYSPETASIEALLIYAAVPLTCGIPSYIIPNIFLNKEKVKQGYDPNYDEKVFGKEDMEGEGIGEPMKGGNEDEI